MARPARLVGVLIAWALAAPLLGASEQAAAATDEPELPQVEEDVCEGAADEGDCALSLRQLRGQKVLADGEAEEGAEADALEGEAEASQLQRTSAEYMYIDKSTVPLGGPPKQALDYNGKAWPNLTIRGTGVMHAFAIGDWGGMDGAFMPEERPRMFLYKGGKDPGPHVFPRSRPGCPQKDLVVCYNRNGNCKGSCGYVPEVDRQPQILVAAQFNARAATMNPSYVLNVGDNFYWAGIAQGCGKPMDKVSWIATHQFNAIFEDIYKGPGIDGKPWLSVLGNHDWGGRQFNNGWDAQIAYSWVSRRWIMPAAYYSVRVDYPDQDFSIDYLMIDSNMEDARRSPNEDPDHNICSNHNKADASCASAGGPTSLANCPTWFWNMWYKQKPWVETMLEGSTADWQAIVTHFPCGFQTEWFIKLHQVYGLDLLVTGHRHDQELWPTSPRLGGLTCFVTGGGGGISSEGSPHPGSHQYGFFDLTLSKDTIIVESINYDGVVNAKSTVTKKEKASEGRCVKYGCGSAFLKGQSCQCYEGCTKDKNCCPDYLDKCEAVLAAEKSAAAAAAATAAPIKVRAAEAGSDGDDDEEPDLSALD